MNPTTLFAYAMEMLRIPYRWGGDDPMEGFDCSGLVLELLMSQGLWPHKIDATSQEIYRRYVKAGCQVNRLPGALGYYRVGLLCFYGTSLTSITHIGMMIDTSGTMIEAGGGGAQTLDAKTAAKQNAFVRLRPFTYRGDLLVTLTVDRPPAP